MRAPSPVGGGEPLRVPLDRRGVRVDRRDRDCGEDHRLAGFWLSNNQGRANDPMAPTR
jgi:hypothetical protein